MELAALAAASGAAKANDDKDRADKSAAWRRRLGESAPVAKEAQRQRMITKMAAANYVDELLDNRSLLSVDGLHNAARKAIRALSSSGRVS